MTDRICTVDDCDKNRVTRLYCPKHYHRFKKHGDPNIVTPRNAPHPGEPTYRAIHKRLRTARGDVRIEQCVLCAGEARDWTYDNSGTDERLDPKGRRYSVNLSTYVPMCRTCHQWFDRTQTPDRFGKTVDECKYGHPLSGTNLHVAPNGKQVCRTCMKQRKHEYLIRKKSQSSPVE